MSRDTGRWWIRVGDGDDYHAFDDLAEVAEALGVHDALIHIEATWIQRRLTGADQFLPLLDQIAQNEIYLHMARQRAAILGEAIRASKAKTQ